MAVFLPETNATVELARGKDFGYQYPGGLDFRPGSPLHEQIKTQCMSMATISKGVMSQRHSVWDNTAQKLTAFIHSDIAQLLEKQADPKKPVNVVVPASYAAYETTLSYLMNQLLISPIFRYEQTEPGDLVRTAILELLVAFQNKKSRAFLELYAALQDALRYGLGIVHCRWETWLGQRTYRRDVTKPSAAVPGESYIEKPAGTRDEYIAFEGNVLESIDPYLYFPDTSVPLYKPERGEFVSWLSPGNNRVKLQELEETSNGYMFNVKYLQYTDNRSILNTVSNRDAKVGYVGMNSSGASMGQRPVDILWMYRDIIPAQLGLGESNRLQKWVFGIANDAVVICAQPTGLDHRRCPLVVMAPEADGHTVMPIARMELSAGAQEILDFDVNTHVQSIAKILRDSLVIDPGILSIASLQDGSIFRYLFLKRSMWGLGKINDAVKQLDVYDPTQNNMRDLPAIYQMSNMAMGTAEADMAGRGRGGERVTATEIRDVRGGTSSRLNKVAALIYAQGFMDLGDMMVSHIKQLMTQETYLKVSGRYRQDLIRELKLNEKDARVLAKPEMFDGNWDSSTADVFSPGNASSQEWTQLYQMLLQNPDSAREVDLTRVFLHIARLLGERNAADFLRQPEPVSVVSDETAEREQQAGNLVPMNGTMMSGATYA